MQNIIKEVEGVLQKQFWVTSTLKCALWDVILFIYFRLLYIFIELLKIINILLVV